ncbi:hypothetical protein [Acinetobacter sp. WCHAc060025]|uniref:hypothetical protein n=1 Tax=Acinetobacter sp. WCHAc060025 TaxID=2518625 RepID=UPI001022C8B0|nr:hypothetical protein [Acinetobacter sp. WCHAc060025]RZG74728.1 hypothetical protein EXE09_12100 [Acinetobacter sp. WCHAc060025]
MLQHRLATPVIQPRMRFFDKEGKPLVGGKVYAFKVGTEEFKPTYRNSEFTALNQNPIVLDNAGSALIYLRGSNQLRIYDKDGNHIENRIEYQQLERAQFYDDYGKPLKNGFVYTYDYQSTIKKTSYSIDAVTNPNPIVLDENGTALVNIVGAYRLRQYNSKNVFVGDQDFKRPPIKALTSWTYPVYADENLTTHANATNAALHDPMHFEQLSVGLTFSNALLRQTFFLKTLDAGVENLSASLRVSYGHLAQSFFLRTFDSGVEDLNVELKIKEAKLLDGITLQQESEKISARLTIISGEIKDV